MNIEGTVKNILTLPPDAIVKNLKSIKDNIDKAYNSLDKTFVNDTLLPTLITLLETHLDNVEIGTLICGLLYFIFSKLGDYVDDKIPLYLEFLKRHETNEMACRNALGLLYAVSKDKSAKTELMTLHIEQVICSILTKHITNDKVANGISKLTKRLAFKNNDRKNALLVSGLGEILIKNIYDVCEERCETNPVIDIFTNLLFSLFYENPTSLKFFREYIDIEYTSSIADNFSNKSYINLDRIISHMGYTMLGERLSFPKLRERIKPITASEPKNVYTTLGHGRELISDEPIPIPAGCVYVTFALCGNTSKEPNRIIEAFLNPKISVLLSDPVANLKQLTEYFGNTLHVHFPEASTEASRYYFDALYSPFAGFKGKDGCWAFKSGLYKMGFTEFNAPEKFAKGTGRLFKYGVKLSCDESLNTNALKFLYDGSIYPTIDILTQGIDPSRILSYEIIQNESTKCRFSQSWAFANFPGVHYNFICRTHRFPEDEINVGAEVNTTLLNRVTRRRANSNAAAANLLAMGKGGNRKSRRRPY